MTYKVIRINYLEKSPFKEYVWDFSKTTVSETNDLGIYGMRVETLELGFDFYLRIIMYRAPNLSCLRFLLIEIEEDNIVHQNQFEITFNKGKKLKEFDLYQFLEFSKVALPGLHKNILSIISIYNKANDASFTIDRWFDYFFELQYEMIENIKKHGVNTKHLKEFFDKEALTLLKKPL